MKNLLSKLTVCSFLIFSTTGCVPIIVAGAAGAGYVAAQEKETKTVVTDLSIATHIKDKLTALRYNYLADIGVSVVEGDVILTGVVKSHSAAREIVAAANKADNVKNVYSELIIADRYSAKEYSKDTWTTTQVKGRLLGSKDIYSINYNVETVKGNVYITGVAKDYAEKERALHVVRTTEGVQKVHDYVKISRKIN